VNCSSYQSLLFVLALFKHGLISLLRFVFFLPAFVFSLVRIPPMGKRRIVVTGLGCVTPLGDTPDVLWAAVSEGKSGVGYLSCVPEDQQTCRIGGEHKSFDPEAYMDKKEARRMDRFTQFAVAAARMAYKDAGLENFEFDRTRLGVVVGSGAGGLNTIQRQLMVCLEKGFHKCSPFLVPMMIPDMAAGRISIDLNAKGPNLCVATACATGTDSIGTAYRMLQYGECDLMIAGGAEAPITSVSVAGFASARALSMRQDDPTKASRPFDKDRDGFVMAEGSGILVLEELEHALARGARIYAELVGYGRSSDANDMVMPCADGDGAARSMQAALNDSDLKAEDMAYVNAHGTSTPLGDTAETLAVKRVFGDWAYKGLLVSSTKSMTGHMLGAAGAVEAMLTLYSLIKQQAPPTINLETPDPQCDLDYVAHVMRPMRAARYAMSNSFGFGGHNGSLVFSTYEA
jgi:3-oxoacyl-[acyl-carrier-protein] synthase II